MSKFRLPDWQANYSFFVSFSLKCLWIFFSNRKKSFPTLTDEKDNLPIEMSETNALKKYV